MTEPLFSRGILSLIEAAHVAGYPPATFRRWARSGQSPFRIVRPDGDRYWCVDGGSFSDWLAHRKGVIRSMPSVFVVDLACLACGRDRQLTVAALAQLPELPERCATCSGSVLAVSTTERTVYTAVPHDWVAERPRLGRPPVQQLPLVLTGGDATS